MQLTQARKVMAEQTQSDAQLSGATGALDVPPPTESTMAPIHCQVQALAHGGDSPILPRSARSNRGRLPLRYRDVLPEPVVPLIPQPTAASIEAHPTDPSSIEIDNTSPRSPTTTKPNTFGLYRVYHSTVPPYDPEEETTLDDLQARNSCRPQIGEASSSANSNLPPWFPFPNKSSFLLYNQYYSQPTKSQADFQGLVDNVMSQPDFIREDVCDVNWKEVQRLISTPLPSHAEGRWLSTSVNIDVPSGNKDDPFTKFTIPRILHRPLEKIIEDAFKSPDVHYHYDPFDLMWSNPHDPNMSHIQVHGEVYTSSAFRQAHEELQASEPEPGCTLPRVVAACLLYSDLTNLTQFGHASLWPVYGWFGNQSKYERAAGGCHHIAYLPEVSWSQDVTMSI